MDSTINKLVIFGEPQRVTTQSCTIDITQFQDGSAGGGYEGGFAFFVAARSWHQTTNAGALWLVSGIQNGLYQNAFQIVKEDNGPTVSVSAQGKTMTITFANTDGGAYAIVPVFNLPLT